MLDYSLFRRKGFTLIELIIVLIIVGILATLGISKFSAFIERSRIAEARTILGDIRKAERAYFMQNTTYANVLTDLLVEAPAACADAYYFSYTITAADDTDFAAEATRCIANGKPPQGSSAYTITVNAIGDLIETP